MERKKNSNRFVISDRALCHRALFATLLILSAYGFLFSGLSWTVTSIQYILGQEVPRLNHYLGLGTYAAGFIFLGLAIWVWMKYVRGTLCDFDFHIILENLEKMFPPDARRRECVRAFHYSRGQV